MAAAPVATRTGKRRTVFIPIGLPGAGKTWLGKHLDRPDFIHLNQDEKNMTLAEYLQLEVEWNVKNCTRHLYIDACNHYPLRRRKIAALAIKYNLQVVFINFKFDVDRTRDALLERIEMKEYHPSVNTLDVANVVFKKFHETLTFFDSDEFKHPGISCITVTTQEEVAELAKKINARK